MNCIIIMDILSTLPYRDIFPIIQLNLNAIDTFSICSVNKYCYENTEIKKLDKLKFILIDWFFYKKFSCQIMFYNSLNEIIFSISSVKCIIHNQKCTNYIYITNTNVPYDVWQNTHYTIEDENTIMCCLKAIDIACIASFKIVNKVDDLDYNKMCQKLQSIIR